MKKCILHAVGLCLCLALLIGMSAAAEGMPTPEFDERLFDCGKESLSLLSYGEYDMAYDAAGFSEEVLSREDFTHFIELNYLEIYNGTVQRDVAVSWYDLGGETWYLAIPVLEPVNGMVETLVFTSMEGTQLDGVCFMTWEEATEQSDMAQDIIWNVEYTRATEKIIQADTPASDGQN